MTKDRRENSRVLSYERKMGSTLIVGHRGYYCPSPGHSGWDHDYYYFAHEDEYGNKKDLCYLDKEEAQDLIYLMQRAWTDLDFNRLSDKEFFDYLKKEKK